MYEGRKRVKKVCFVIPNLGGGGAQRVLLNILRHIDHSKFDPHLILFEKKRFEKKGDLLFDLPSDINVRVLRSKKYRRFLKWFYFLKLVKLLKAEGPDAVVSFMWKLNAAVLLSKKMSRTKAKIIISERGSTAIYNGRFVNFQRSLAIRFFYPKAEKIIFPSRDMADKIVKSYGIEKQKMNIIHNPVDIAMITERAQERIEDPVYQAKNNIIISIGRLGKEKGFAYLIRAISLLSKNDIDCKLVILGEGAEENNLYNLSKELNIEDRVRFLGFRSNPYKYLARSKIFVLSSLYEGFPNVLLEAMALGVPSIATRCPTGPEEIITDEVNGLLIPQADEKALANAIKKLLLDKDLRERLSEAARKRAEDFRVEKIIMQYEDVIDNVCAASAEN